ncbi:MAG: hypothetical protein P8170_22850, partial [Gemmatimonadota bacterium]
RLLRLHDELDEMTSSSRASWKGGAILLVILTVFGTTLFQLGIGSEAAVELGVLVLAGAGIIGAVEIARRRRIRGLRQEILELERGADEPGAEAS